jgi:hypothetical protein
MPRARQDSEAVDIERGQFGGCHLQDVTVFMGLHEFVPVGRRAPRGCDWWHSSGNSSPTRAISFAQAIREVSCERGF